jgi:Anti-sigma-K factor rskA, C-terminal
VLPQAAGLEQRLADLEAQIERLTVTLVRWRETEEHRQPAERRLAQLTEQYADLLKQWTATSERHADAVGELETRLTGWNDIESRLQRDASSRLQGLERTIEREWASLRQLHEEPARQLREQAETLTEISVNAAGSAQTGIERAEARLATLEHDLHRRIDDLSRDIHAVLAELRHHGGPALRSPASSWSLDEVTRLHHELRDGSSVVANHPATFDGSVSQNSTTTFAPLTVSPPFEPTGEKPGATLFEPLDVGGSAAADDGAEGARSAWKWYAAFAGLALAIGIVAAYALSFYSRANLAAERAFEAQQRAERIASAADQRIEAARQDAAAQIIQARDAASKVQVTTDVLAASDLVRFSMTGGDSAVRISAQLLWSRSRGLVFSGSRMPPLPSGSIYQVWLLTAGEPVSAGTVAPDASGRVAIATDEPPNVPRPIVGVRVTVEPVPGSPAPTGATVLARAP